jgi:hypothetical protein
MQYNKWRTIANRHGAPTPKAISFMPRLPTLSMRLVAVLLPLGLSACADALTSKDTASSATLQRDYDKTLTKDEQKAAISDMQAATTKRTDPAAGSN